MKNQEYLRGYSDAIKDVENMLHKLATENTGNGDPLAVWWAKRWIFPKKLQELYEQARRRN